MRSYQTFNHTADLGLIIKGETEEDLYANAAIAVFDIITDLRRVEPRETRRIAVDGGSPTDLLINFLREILYLYNGEHWLLKGIRILEFSEKALEAEACGEPLVERKHKIYKEIKAVTYHQAEVCKTCGGWTAKVIFDV
jgi:SHS2 domain-containing protein